MCKRLSWLAGQFQQIRIEPAMLRSRKKSEPVKEKGAFLRQEVEAVAKLVRKRENGRSKLIGFGKASPQGILRRRIRRFQRRCNFLQCHCRGIKNRGNSKPQLYNLNSDLKAYGFCQISCTV